MEIKLPQNFIDELKKQFYSVIIVEKDNFNFEVENNKINLDLENEIFLNQNLYSSFDSPNNFENQKINFFEKQEKILSQTFINNFRLIFINRFFSHLNSNKSYTRKELRIYVSEMLEVFYKNETLCVSFYFDLGPL